MRQVDCLVTHLLALLRGNDCPAFPQQRTTVEVRHGKDRPLVWSKELLWDMGWPLVVKGGAQTSGQVTCRGILASNEGDFA